jgi:hypothetical protein
MTLLNTRRTANDSYSPKQRIVGGVVLFLIMLLIYSFLKLLLGMSAMPEGAYRLPEPLPGEMIEIENGEIGGTTESPVIKQVRLPMGFVFLDINGNPMKKETYEELIGQGQSSETVSTVAIPVADADKTWVVQVASFKENSRAQNLVEKLKEKQMESTIVRKGRWYAVQLLPTNKTGAEEQLKKLQTDLGIKGMIKEIK